MLSKIIVTVFALSVFIATVASAEVDMLPQKRELIKDLLRVVDARNMTTKQIDAQLENLKTNTLPQMLVAGIQQQYDAQQLAGVPEDKKDAVIKKYSARIVEKIRKAMSEKLDIAGLSERILFDLYGKYFDEKELQAIIDFYRSPVGSKTISLMPQIYAEAMKSASDATNKVMIDVYMTTIKEEMIPLIEELFPSKCEDDDADED